MLKGMVAQEFGWESYEAILSVTYSSCKRIYPMTSNMLGEEKSGEVLDYMTSNLKAREPEPHGQ